MEEINELIEQRIKKLEELRQAGFEPFGGAFYAEDHASDLHDKFGSSSKEPWHLIRFPVPLRAGLLR